MGTLNRAVNFFKGIFNRQKSKSELNKGDSTGQSKYVKHVMMARKFRGHRNRNRQYHGAREIQFHGGGGGRVSMNMSDQAIYYPKRTKLKGWQKENRRSSFNKKRRAA